MELFETCRCGHPKDSHDAKYNDPQCSRCPEDGERSWRHEYKRDLGPADEDADENRAMAERWASAYETERAENAILRAELRNNWYSEEDIRNALDGS